VNLFAFNIVYRYSDTFIAIELEASMSGHVTGRGVYPVLIAQLCAVLAAGCISAAQQPISAWNDDDTPMRRDVNLRRPGSTLTRVDLQSTGLVSALAAVGRLRPEFLLGSNRIQPATGPRQIAVYLNSSYAGDLSTLETIPIDAIREIAFVQPVEAQLRFGPFCRCASGALLITTLRVGGR
jgi:hypothetical protein